jgi:hypothetical protein
MLPCSQLACLHLHAAVRNDIHNDGFKVLHNTQMSSESPELPLCLEPLQCTWNSEDLCSGRKKQIAWHFSVFWFHFFFFLRHGLELLGWRDPPSSATWVDGMTDATTWLYFDSSHAICYSVRCAVGWLVYLVCYLLGCWECSLKNEWWLHGNTHSF